MGTYSLIPARIGSKAIPKKNIKLLGGFPLIAYSIIASRLSKKITRTIVSTDSEEIAIIARSFGAETPFLRPSEFAQDSSADFPPLRHAAEWFTENDTAPTTWVYLRPTTPFRDPTIIDEATKQFLVNPQADSLRSGHEAAEPPQKMFHIDAQGFFSGYFPDDPRPEYHSLPRQLFPKAYIPNGYVDIVRQEFLLNNQTAFGLKILGFSTSHATEADNPRDWEFLEFELNRDPGPLWRYLSSNYSSKQ
ncbi:MAG: acylneuraminate cytidylyltransferase family protein [bacterium]|nr:acylneuraminate cytidylyltransferase family protein [bacterium]